MGRPGEDPIQDSNNQVYELFSKMMPTTPSRWPDLPSDVLFTIADSLNPEIGTLRLRSVCNSWRSSLPPSPPAISFPLKLPSPPSNGSSTSSSSTSTPDLLLRRKTIYLLSPRKPISYGGSRSFLVKVEERDTENENPSNTVSLLNPPSGRADVPKPKTPLNLLDYTITHVCDSHIVDRSGVNSGENPIKKAVVSTGFFEIGDFVVLGLKWVGSLVIWKLGDEEWTEIEANGRSFDDVISYNGRFYATADQKGRLLMIDSRLKPNILVPKLMFGDGMFTHLVECDGVLYLVDREVDKFGVFKLDDKDRFWDYELDLNDGVFYVGDDVNFALSKKDYNGGIRNVIYYKDVHNVSDGNDGFVVFDMKSKVCSSFDMSKGYAMLFWPPSSWFIEDAAFRFC